jgi:hypothetical protein
MASEVLKLTAQIVMSHASMSELSPDELVDEIKEIYNVLSALEAAQFWRIWPRKRAARREW